LYVRPCAIVLFGWQTKKDSRVLNAQAFIPSEFWWNLYAYVLKISQTRSILCGTPIHLSTCVANAPA